MIYNLPHSTTHVRFVSCHVACRPLGYVDHITVLFHVCRSSASLIQAMELLLVHSTISVGEVHLISPRSLPTHHASRHVQANQTSIDKPLKLLQRTIPTRSGSHSPIMYFILRFTASCVTVCCKLFPSVVCTKHHILYCHSYPRYPVII